MGKQANDAYPKAQPWKCDKCKKSGKVEFTKGEDVMSVVHKIGDSHRKKSTRCDQPTGMIRALPIQ